MRRVTVALLLTCTACLIALPATARSKEKKKKGAAITALAAKSDSTASFTKKLRDASAHKGIINAWHDMKKGKLYLQVPDNILGRDLLLVNRINGLSQTADYVAGQMCGSPMLVRFSKLNNKIYLHLGQTATDVDPADPISAAYDRNFLDPVLKAFTIELSDSAGHYIDATAFFAGNEKSISPIKESTPLTKLLGGKEGIKGTFYADGSAISSVKAFPRNLEVESRLAYTTPTATRPYTVSMSRSIVLLPEKPMRPRLQDNRVGYFYDLRNRYSSDADRLQQYTIINRHRLEPKEGEMEAYLSGELVEPRSKIVFYVDSAFPEKWRGAVKEGIEYWNRAFEEAGFKNAVEARDYPKDDPDFDPDDIRYNCVRYCMTATANAMGPSYTDPRSGEILGADVIWYHNVLSLVHDWRFTQTAAVDPRVRKPVFDDSVMHESLTYVVAHEIGHCLGLMHNMGASHAFSIDQLRDPQHSRTYGTTPSIMDYARNNYVAQPGDMERGVSLTPPHLGVYDIYAINWGYRIIPGAEDPRDEKPTLDAWIRAHDGDCRYEFGAQQIMGLVDPTDQTEDLGNDHVEAGNLAISNLKIIADNFEEWAGEPGETYERLGDAYEALVKQYLRHVGHVYPYIGGVIFKEIRQGAPDGPSRSFVSKKEQKRAMDWLLDQARSCDWLTPPALMAKWEEPLQWKEKMRRTVTGCLLSPANLQRIKEGGLLDPSANYLLTDYMDDAVRGIFAATYAGKPLTDADVTMQNAAVTAMAKLAGVLPAQAKSTDKGSKGLTDCTEEYAALAMTPQEPPFPCGAAPAHTLDDNSRSFFRICLSHQQPLADEELRPLMLSRLRGVQSLYRSRRAATTDRRTRDFYDYQLHSIGKMLDK